MTAVNKTLETKKKKSLINKTDENIVDTFFQSLMFTEKSCGADKLKP